MDVAATVDTDTVRLRVAGELDVLSVAHVVPVIEDLLRGPQARWIIDLSHLRIIDSSGVGLIIYTFRKLRDRGGELAIEGANAQPLSILRLMRLDQVLQHSPP